ncbi:hypothetical protein Agub_g9847 [Astrephomene gubernaculifera]|uniref:Uncharacterized protein n=1 Tax=Astrephomene gubernaculifera TaxID=47775 RepID=A0AAD3DVR7_9CHLO|nr:hypothetical protein Agub_g9847 [Astrephomene gubernaculifera]
MACAVALPCSALATKFKGDSAELLDRLVEVCNTVMVPNNAKVVERELLPFCFDNAPPLPKAGPRSPPKGRSPRCSPPKQQKASGGVSPSGSRRGGVASCASSPSHSSLDGSCYRTPKQPATNNRFTSLESADDLARVLRAPGVMVPPASVSVRACPGFFSSPRPCDIPMPTSTLLVKAALVKA